MKDRLFDYRHVFVEININKWVNLNSQLEIETDLTERIASDQNQKH